jgi:hypothetical protein
MRHFSRAAGRFFPAALLITAAALSVPACSITDTCNCPEGQYGMVTVPGDSSRSLGLVTSNIECLAWDSGAAGLERGRPFDLKSCACVS